MAREADAPCEPMTVVETWHCVQGGATAPNVVTACLELQRHPGKRRLCLSVLEQLWTLVNADSYGDCCPSLAEECACQEIAAANGLDAILATMPNHYE